jgi:hypothetical protein
MAGGLLVGLLVALLLAVPRPVEARHYVHHRVLHHVVHRVGYVPEAESIIIDADTGQVLSQSNADALTYPASLTKMMTLFLTFQALNSGQLHLDQQLVTSLHASERMPTKLGLRPGELVPVRDLILGIVTRSANDAATVLAEGQAGGSEAAFCARMNAEARQLGMTHTFFHNASGVPDPLQRALPRLSARIPLFLDPGIRFQRPDHHWPQPSARLVSRRRRNQDRVRQRLGLQSRGVGGAQRPPADRRGDGRSHRALARSRNGIAARPGVCRNQRARHADRAPRPGRAGRPGGGVAARSGGAHA